ncbi:unnamed protein product [Ceutorhynchus assimilis]|uniref:DUF4773 domain-containing protein n=1 Tax=Ceutorhynchus assimilis TaxID=467358 RepID=A0A9N9MH46_9CUCU|nr:unnamed protein product [Ceutorhynchus assimilis]
MKGIPPTVLSQQQFGLPEIIIYQHSSVKLRLARRNFPYTVFEMTTEELLDYKSLAEKIRLRVTRKLDSGCMNFTYDPQEFAVVMDMVMDGNLVFSTELSAKNPPPLCIPLPIPYIPIQVETCAKLFDIYTPGQNLHMCLDFETRIEKATILVLHFDCMRMGNDGVALVKPGDTDALPPSLISVTTPSQIDSDVYDPVTEIKKN